jgi:ribosome-associated toxin RatA of RatAB toxin-antitoxin module
MSQGNPKFAWWFALLLLVAKASAEVVAGTTNFESTRRGATVEIHAVAQLSADAALAWHVLTDYERYTDFIPDLRTCHVVSRDGATVVVEQSGDAMLGALRWPIDVTFVIREFPPDRLESRAVAGSLRALYSTYTLAAANHGMRLTYDGRVTLGFAFFGPIEEATVQRNVARQFDALVTEIERRATAARAAPAGR